MSDPISQANSLSYLIPTGEHDIAVREVLVPIFGDAILCKIPGAVCNALSSAEASATSGALVETLFSVFNAGTVVFATILLIFIGLMVFVRTAQDGEFMGKSWNTTFTALRLVAGIAFILPMPNGYSTIQNFVMYVGLWSSGLANQSNVAISEHYMKRLQLNMINQDKSAIDIRREAKAILEMHICAKVSMELYGKQGMKLEVRRRSALIPIDFSNPIEEAKKAIGSLFLLNPKEKTERIEVGYVEMGTHLYKGAIPCGRLIINPIKNLDDTVVMQTAVPDNAYNAAWAGLPLTRDARELIAKSLQNIAENAQTVKLEAMERLMSKSGQLNVIADKVVASYLSKTVKTSDDGRVISGPENADPNANGLTSKLAKEIIDAYAKEVREAEDELNGKLDSYREQALQATTKGADSSYFALSKVALQGGGWMGAAATYRMMLDMVSIKFTGEKQSPIKIEGSNLENEGMIAPGLMKNILAVKALIDETLSSDTAKAVDAEEQKKSSNPTPNKAPEIDSSSLAKLASGKLTTDAALDTIFGAGPVDSMRSGIIKKLSISSDYDPLFQIKSAGDMATDTAALLITGEFLFRSVVAVSEGVAEWANKTIVGLAANAFGVGPEAGAVIVRGVKYLGEQVFVITRTMTAALSTIGYMYSTWMPAIPYMAFLLASLGWLFGLVMTLFAVNIWGVMHLTPARNDSFIGSEAQGYLLIAALFFRPIIAISALSLSYVMAPPIMRLVNMTLIPMMLANNVSTNTTSVIFASVFNLILYFAVAKAVITMVYMIPQSFPDQVMKIISAGIGDLGEGQGMRSMEASEGTGRIATQTMGGANQASSDSFKGVINERKAAKEKVANDAKELQRHTEVVAAAGRGDSNQLTTGEVSREE